MKNNDYCVYIHRNITNNKAYIGITKHGDSPDKRWRGGEGYVTQPLFYNAIKKYGWDSFEHIIWADKLSEDDAKKLEIMLIDLFHTADSRYGYNISIGGEAFTMSDIQIAKRTLTMVETKNQNRIQKSIEMFKGRYDSGDKNILQCQRCGAYFEKNAGTLVNNNKRDASKKQTSRITRKYCDYCSIYHQHSKRIIACVDCGKEFVVKSKDNKTCRCEDCQNKVNKERYIKYNQQIRS